MLVEENTCIACEVHEAYNKAQVIFTYQILPNLYRCPPGMTSKLWVRVLSDNIIYLTNFPFFFA